MYVFWTRCVARVAHSLIIIVVRGAWGACVTQIRNTVPNIPLLAQARCHSCLLGKERKRVGRTLCTVLIAH